MGKSGNTTTCMVFVMMSRNSQNIDFSVCDSRWAMPRPKVNAITKAVIMLSEAGMLTVKNGSMPFASLICASCRLSVMSAGNTACPTP